MSTRTTCKAALPHLSSDEAKAMVRERIGKREVTDRCAATIASWWQSPDSGDAMATLAGGREVDVDQLLDDIHATRREVTADTSLTASEVEVDTRALDMLATWALHGGES